MEEWVLFGYISNSYFVWNVWSSSCFRAICNSISILLSRTFI